jgi:hypothetical protein
MRDSSERRPAGGERFTVRGYRQGDESAILDLFARSFHQQRSVAYLRWKYEQNPFGNERSSLTFDESGRLVAQYAGYVVPFFHRGEERIAHHIGDIMSDRSVRHIGLGPTSIHGRNALHFYQQFCDGRVAFNYGFSTATSQKFAIRFLRAERVEPAPYRIRDLRSHPMPRIGRLGRWQRGYQLESVTNVGEEYDRFFARAAPAYAFLVRRDARYLRWRYFQAPESPYFMVAIRKWRRLVGWAVFRIRNNGLAWGDALFDSRYPDAVEVLLSQAVPRDGVERIEGWFPRRPAWFAAVLDRLKLIGKPEPQDLALMCVPFTMADAVERMRQDLYYTLGDSDLY